MFNTTHALRAATAAALLGSVGCLGAATANADPSDALTSSLSKGYSTSNCGTQPVSEVQSTFPTVQAIMACGQNADSAGPASAKYFQFPNSADLASAFHQTHWHRHPHQLWGRQVAHHLAPGHQQRLGRAGCLWHRSGPSRGHLDRRRQERTGLRPRVQR